MSVVLKLVQVAALLAAAWYLTHRLLPRACVWAGRRLGLAMRMNPIWEKRIKRFRSIKRGYYSYVVITTLFVLSFFFELVINSRPLLIYFDGKAACPAVLDWLDHSLPFVGINSYYRKSDFGQVGESEVDYRLFAREAKDPAAAAAVVDEWRGELRDLQGELAVTPKPERGAMKEELLDYEDLHAMIEEVKAEIEVLEAHRKAFEAGKAWVLMPLYPYSPYEHLLDMPGKPPHNPSLGHPMGTDDSAADIMAQLLYGFRVSLAFALVVALLGYGVGVIVGGIMGYFGGWTDILIQRFIEVWSSIPFLFTIMIIASIVQPKFLLLVLLLVLLRSWLGITYYVRGEFYREKAKDYVQAAIGMGASEWSVMVKHILPNSLVPVVTFAPFGIVSYIMLLVSLDYLGFGLPVGTPSWGALLDQGMKYIKYYPHLILIPSVSFAMTLFCVVMIGEAVREAFDPKVFSRLR